MMFCLGAVDIPRLQGWSGTARPPCNPNTQVQIQALKSLFGGREAALCSSFVPTSFVLNIFSTLDIANKHRYRYTDKWTFKRWVVTEQFCYNNSTFSLSVIPKAATGPFSILSTANTSSSMWEPSSTWQLAAYMVKHMLYEEELHSCIRCLWLFVTVRRQMLTEKRQNTIGTGECGKLIRCRGLCSVQSCVLQLALCTTTTWNCLIRWQFYFQESKCSRQLLSDFTEFSSTPLRGVPFPNSKAQTS